MPRGKLEVGKAHAHDQVAALKKAVSLGQARDLFLHDQRPELMLQLEAARFARMRHLPVSATLAQSLDFYVAQGVTDPAGSAWLAGFQEDLGRRTGEHNFGLVAVDGLQLAPPLKAQHDGVSRFSVLRDGCRELGQSV